MPAPADVLARIAAFEIDGPGPAPALPFAARLAREHGWTRRFADRVVREYLRFAALAVGRENPVCPSEQVDAAWHLHLTYTRSYWKRFCGDVLGQPLHHDPTRGGAAEAGKHRAMYAATLAAYRETFGEAPPADIWPPVDVRFGPDARHVVVNTAANWVVPKAWVRRAAAATGLAATVLVAASGCVGGLANPFDLVGTDFLYFLIPAMISAVALGRFGRSVLQYPGPEPGDEDLKFDWEQAAYLTGGAARLTTAAIARMIAAGTVRVTDDGKSLDAAGPTPAVQTRSENAIWLLLPLKNDRGDLKKATDAVGLNFAEEAARLRDEGFLLTGGRKLGVYLLGLLPLAFVVLAFGAPRWVMGVAAGKPVTYLVMTLIFGGFAGFVVAMGGSVRTTRRGDEVIDRLKDANARLKKGDGTTSADAAALGVALFGAAVLVDPMYAALNSWYPRQVSGDGGCSTGCGTSGDGGGGDGGGGCGSGCGGCGGGGD